MKVFAYMEIREAIAYAMAGGQALHLHRIVFEHSPACFRSAIERGEHIAHLFDQNTPRLKSIARSLGVRQVYVHHDGTDHQHVDLCGAPLKKAMVLVDHD